jgi:hypothetical protein
MADPKPPRKPNRRRPPKPAAVEHPVDDADVEAIGDAALEEPALEPDEGWARGGADPDEGFGATLAETRRRAAQLQSGQPDARNLVGARRKKAFLMALASTGNVTIACAAAGWPRSFPYSLRKQDEEFAEQWAFCTETAADLLEAAALQRAVHGVQEDVWHKPKDGSPEVIGHKTIYSDRLLETLLKANRPEKFRERHEVKHEGSRGGVLVLPAPPSIEDFEAAAYRQQAQFRERRED